MRLLLLRPVVTSKAFKPACELATGLFLEMARPLHRMLDPSLRSQDPGTNL